MIERATIAVGIFDGGERRVGMIPEVDIRVVGRNDDDAEVVLITLKQIGVGNIFSIDVVENNNVLVADISSCIFAAAHSHDVSIGARSAVEVIPIVAAIDAAVERGAARTRADRVGERVAREQSAADGIIACVDADD